MLMLVRLFALVMVVFGIINMLNPEVMKKYIAFWAKGKRLQVGGIISLVIGIIFLFTAPQCNIPWLVVLMGIIALIKGVVLLVLGPEKWLANINWWTSRPPMVLRILSVVTIVLGVVLINAAS
jgi:uncharacterized protein YjeT (DUF2065 family)